MNDLTGIHLPPRQPGRLPAAEARLERWRYAVTLPAGPDARPLLAEVRRFLADDLDTVGAMGAVDRWAHEANTNRGNDADAPALVRDLVDALLGIEL